jgi:Ca2+-binding RTX toxin-like protein
MDNLVQVDATYTVNGGNNGNTIDASALTGGNRAAVAGGAGTDVLKGGSGNDFFSLSAATLATATVTGGGGSDVLALTTAGALSLAGVGGIKTVTLKSGAANTLSLADANFTGVAGNAITVNGGNNGDTLSESGVAPTNLAVLLGGSGIDTLIAGLHATLTGGLGADVFEFATSGSIATPDSNTITDFVHGTDKFTFSDIGFALGLAGATSTPQALPSNLFSSKTDGTFDNTTERFAYNATTGQVVYSDDGSGPDPSRAVATLTGHPTLTASDLYFVT